MTVTAIQVQDLVKTMLLTDLRVQCRARGLNPGGSRDTLAERLKEHMLETGDITIYADGSTHPVDADGAAAAAITDASGSDAPTLKNNYVRPEGQNVGNFITDRPSSRVLAPPGGGSSITLG